jgi:hypothetical protein
VTQHATSKDYVTNGKQGYLGISFLWYGPGDILLKLLVSFACFGTRVFAQSKILVFIPSYVEISTYLASAIETTDHVEFGVVQKWCQNASVNITRDVKEIANRE